MNVQDEQVRDRILVTVEGPVARITLNRPRQLNPLDLQMFVRLGDQIEQFDADPDVRVIVLGGAGGAFSSGIDLRSAGAAMAQPGAAPDGATIDAANFFTAAVLRGSTPVVAVVRGVAAGIGLSVALAADVVIAAESAYFLLAFSRIGLMPDGGATALVTSSVGRATAMRMALLADKLTAPDAAAAGLIAICVPDDELDGCADGIVARLAVGPTAAYARTKQAINATAITDLEAALAREREGQLELLASGDFAHGLAAFAAKRTPTFRGR